MTKFPPGRDCFVDANGDAHSWVSRVQIEKELEKVNQQLSFLALKRSNGRAKRPKREVLLDQRRQYEHVLKQISALEEEKDNCNNNNDDEIDEEEKPHILQWSIPAISQHVSLATFSNFFVMIKT